MSDSPAACTTVGLSLTITKLAVFTLSAGMAGLAGALYGGLEGAVDAHSSSSSSLAFFLAVSLGGPDPATGPLLAGVFLAVVPVIAPDFTWGADFPHSWSGIGIVAIGRNPNGIGLLYAKAAAFWERYRGPRRGDVGSARGAGPCRRASEVGSVG